MPRSFADVMAELNAAKARPQPVSVWVKDGFPSMSDPLGQKRIFGAKYDDGSSRDLFSIDVSDYDSQDAAEGAIVAAFMKLGIDVSQVPGFHTATRRRTTAAEILARQQQLYEAMANNAYFGRAMPGSGFYERATRDEIPGAAFGDSFTDRLQRAADAAKPDPERIKAIERCRALKKLADHATANPGEAANARAAIDRLKERHQIRDSEI